MPASARVDTSIQFEAAAPEVVDIASLGAARVSPRQGPLDGRHVRALQEVLELVPPIIVHRATMRVIDGAHRLEAIRQSGRTKIRVVFFDGSDFDAFVLAIQANATHGRPLSFEERKGAALALLSRYPDRSTRWIASVCGLSSATVSRLRPDSGEAERRIGIDGRSRPVDPTAIRSSIAERLAAEPEASVRQVATAVGASPSTVRRIVEHRAKAEDDRGEGDGSVPTVDQLALWLEATAIPEDRGLDLVATIPPIELAPAAEEFRRRAEYWAHLADLAAERARS